MARNTSDVVAREVYGANSLDDFAFRCRGRAGAKRPRGGVDLERRGQQDRIERREVARVADGQTDGLRLDRGSFIFL